MGRAGVAGGAWQWALVALVALSLGLTSPPALAGSHFSPGAPGIGDPYFPLAGNGGYDVRHYGLDLRYDPATDRLSGVATIRATATQDLSRFDLDFVGLDVRAIAVDGRPAGWRRDGGELIVRPRAGCVATSSLSPLSKSRRHSSGTASGFSRYWSSRSRA